MRNSENIYHIALGDNNCAIAATYYISYYTELCVISFYCILSYALLYIPDYMYVIYMLNQYSFFAVKI